MKALIIYGGWDGHEPKAVAQIFERELKKQKVTVEVSDTLASLEKLAYVKSFDVIVPHWTMGEMSKTQWENLNKAVRGGVGLAGVHGGMGDSMRSNLGFQWMVGGQFVGHPHVGDYEVYLTETANPITAGMPTSFPYNSEQYYMLTDPGINILAETIYDWDGHKIAHPVAWTKTWGKGRVFYSALGHVAKEFREHKHVLAMTVRGMLWAAEGKK